MTPELTYIEEYLMSVTLKRVPKVCITLLTCLTTPTHARAVVGKSMLGDGWRRIQVDANLEDGKTKPIITSKIVFNSRT